MNVDSFELEDVISYGNLGYYNYCEVIQIVLIGKAGDTINYFTHVDFSNKHQIEKQFNFLSKKPISINDDFRLALSHMVIPINNFVDIYTSAIQTGIWGVTHFDKKIEVSLDNVFPTEKKYVPSNDPTGGQYGLNIPLEEALYGSNFIGNYYIHELFSKKTILSKLDKKSHSKIHENIKKHKLNFNLEKLSDRIGNVVCKFNSEILRVIPKKLGPLNGIELQVSTDKCLDNFDGFRLVILQEHDGLIYRNSIVDNYKCDLISLDPNQVKTRITIIDNTTGLIHFSEVFDYTQYSNYHSQVTPPVIVSQGHLKKRKVIINEEVIDIELSGVSFLGDIFYFVEMEEANTRRQIHEDIYFKQEKYFMSYLPGQHDVAIQDIKEIINSKLLWDLKEVCVIDPYLSSREILQTVVHVKKSDVIVKCLCDYSALHGNPETKKISLADTYENYKSSTNRILSDALSVTDDLNLEYRSVYSNHGAKFHDRFLILKYELNKTRVWSLGASINSIGDKHSIIQIVEAPEEISTLFDETWEATNNDECLLYKSKSN